MYNVNKKKIAEDKDEPAATTRSRVKVGMRCQVSPGARRGQVMHVGEVPELPSRRKIIETEKKGKRSNYHRFRFREVERYQKHSKPQS